MRTIEYRGFGITLSPTYQSDRDVWEVFVVVSDPEGNERRYKAPQVYRSIESAEERCLHYGKGLVDAHPDAK